MILQSKRSGVLVLRLIVALALLGWPRVGAAQGTWSVISLPQQPGEVTSPTALAVDAAGNLYVSEFSDWGARWIQKRDAQGHWSVIAIAGSAPDQVGYVTALALDSAGNLYVADGWYQYPRYSQIQKRDALGNCYENRNHGRVQTRGTPAAPFASRATGR